MCSRSPALQASYSWISRRLVQPAARLLAPSLPLFKALAMPPGRSHRPTVPVSEALLRCASYQSVLQVVLGLWVPSWLAYRRELRARKDFLSAHGALPIKCLRSQWDFFIYAMPAFTFPWLVARLAAPVSG